MCFLGVFFFIEAQSAFNELDRRDQEYTKAVLDLETSAVGVLHLHIAVGIILCALTEGRTVWYFLTV